VISVPLWLIFSSQRDERRSGESIRQLTDHMAA
jgi:hypothetical protein